MTQIEMTALSLGDRVRGIVSGVLGTVIDQRNNSVRVRWSNGATEWCGAGDIDRAKAGAA